MTKTLLFLSIFIYSFCYSQDSTKVFSYYFANKTDQFKNITEFKTTKLGVYKLQKGTSSPFNNYDLRIEAGENLILDESGIYIEKNKILNISRSEIRENSKFSIRNGYLHGVLSNDSLPVALQGESFYFLMPTKAYLYETANTKQQIVDVSNQHYLVLSQEDNGYYSALKIQFIKNSIQLSELDLNYTESKSIKHTKITENGFETFLFNPKQKEWDLILSRFKLFESYSK